MPPISGASGPSTTGPGLEHGPGGLQEVHLPGECSSISPCRRGDRAPDAEVSKATGIPAAFLWWPPPNDQAVGPLGAGLIDEKAVLVSLGTYIPSCVKGRAYRGDARTYFMNMACIPTSIFYESGGIRRGMWTVSWFRNLFGDEIAAKAASMGLSVEAYLEREAGEVPAGSDGLFDGARLAGPGQRAPSQRRDDRLRRAHTRAHMYRSILEAIALTMKNHSEPCLRKWGWRPIG